MRGEGVGLRFRTFVSVVLRGNILLGADETAPPVPFHPVTDLVGNRKPLAGTQAILLNRDNGRRAVPDDTRLAAVEFPVTHRGIKIVSDRFEVYLLGMVNPIASQDRLCLDNGRRLISRFAIVEKTHFFHIVPQSFPVGVGECLTIAKCQRQPVCSHLDRALYALLDLCQ